MGIEFDGWQDGMGQLLMAKDEEDIIAHTVGGFGLSAMRQIGKAGATNEPLLTSNRGWTTFGEIEVGDQVFHPDGHSVEVVGRSPIMLNHDCYQVTTTDGRSIVVDGDHLWTVRDKRLMGHPWRNLTTAEMYASGLERSPQGERTVTTDGKQYRTTEYRYVLPQQKSLVGLVDIEESIDPYLLGAWLGNGTAGAAQLSSGTEDVNHWTIAVIESGFTPTPVFVKGKLGEGYRIGITSPGPGNHERSFSRKMRQLNVLDNKHIPEHYLISSTPQRLALLQGLLDTDGHITKTGTVEFCSTTKDLADGVLFLARSLGWRATVREGKATLDGRDCGVKYRITFTPKMSDPYAPFRLQRKVDRIGLTDGGKGRFTVAIKSIEPVATRPVRCIKVASSDGLFLAGRDLIPTHNTYFFAGAFFGMCQQYPGLLVIWSAHHSATHEETFLAMQGFASRRRIAPFVRQVLTGSGDESVIFHNDSRILFGARERGFGRGVPGVDVLMNDEGQILSERAMQNMLATMNTSRIGIHVYAGTPPKPEDKSETWMRMRDEAWTIEDPEVNQVDTEDMVWVEIGAEDGCDLDDRQQWYSNPSFPHRTPIQAFMRLRKKLNDDGWRREGLGLYDPKAESEFDLAKWNTLIEEDAPQPTRAALVLDVSPDRRWCSIAVAGEFDEDRALVIIKSLKGTATVVSEIGKIDGERALEGIWITPGAARALETSLTKANFEYDILTQSEVSASYGDLQVAIQDGTVAHVDQPELNAALKMARSRMLQTGESESFDRREYVGVDISPAVSAACALYKWGLNNEPLPFIG